MDVADLVRQVPEGIWGVVIGALLAFGGTYLATGRQLRHDAAQREIDRKMQLRKEVFLEVAASVPGTEQFMKLANAELPVSELGISSTTTGWLNKLQTVASVEAIQAFYSASAALGAAAFDLFRRRMSIDEVNGKIDATNQRIELMNAMQERIRSIAAAMPNEVPIEQLPQGLAAMQQHLEEAWLETERLAREVAQFRAEQLRLRRQLLECAVEYSLSYQKKLRVALVALRAELALPIDHEKLEAALDQIDAEMLPKFKDLLDAIDGDTQRAAV